MPSRSNVAAMMRGPERRCLRRPAHDQDHLAISCTLGLYLGRQKPQERANAKDPERAVRSGVGLREGGRLSLRAAACKTIALRWLFRSWTMPLKESANRASSMPWPAGAASFASGFFSSVMGTTLPLPQRVLSHCTLAG